MLGLLVLSVLSASEPRDVVFAAARSSTVDSGRDAPLGPPVRVVMGFGGTLYARRALIDAAGHVGVFRPGAPTLALPFSEPMQEVSTGESQSLAMVCGRTLGDDLECLTASGDVQYFLERPELRSRVKRLRFPSLTHKVTRLSALGELCLRVGKEPLTCVQRRVEGYGDGEKFSLVAPSPRPEMINTVITDPAALQLKGDTSARCAITDGALRCEGTSVYGQLGNGATDAAQAVSTPLPGRVAEVVAGERYFCARTEEGKVACWGALPAGLPLESPANEHYPLCKIDRAQTEANWKAEVAEAKHGFAACLKAPCPKGMLDCKLGCSAQPREKRTVFVHTVLCEEAAEGAAPRAMFTTRPLFLKTEGVRSVAANGPQLCLIGADHALQCFGY